MDIAQRVGKFVTSQTTAGIGYSRKEGLEIGIFKSFPGKVELILEFWLLIRIWRNFKQKLFGGLIKVPSKGYYFHLNLFLKL